MENIVKEIQVTQLENGLSCYMLQACGGEDNFSMCLLVKAGTACEQVGKQGWLHFLEHSSIYPSLYNCVETESKRGKFLAFDYAYTSFYETAFWFHGTDGTGDLLLDSIKTAKGILSGTYLREEVIENTKKDVLGEYEDYYKKGWFQEIRLQMAKKNFSMPVGEKRDILQINYKEMSEMRRKYYREDNAAVIIKTSKNIEEIETLLRNTFQSKIYLAWVPREIVTGDLFIQRDIELSIIARAIEIVFQKESEIEDVQCDVSIFNYETYLFQLEVDGPISQNLNKNKMFFSELLFEQSKRAVQKQLKEQYDARFMYCDGEEKMHFCREHFLFGEPILNFENEYERYGTCLQNCLFDDVKEKYDVIMEQYFSV